MSDLHPVREFFRSDKMLEFIGEHCEGTMPWATVVDADNRLVVTSPERDVYFVMKRSDEEGRFDVHSTYDALQVIDPEAEMDEVGHAPTAEAAFEKLKSAAYGMGLPEPEDTVAPKP